MRISFGKMKNNSYELGKEFFERAWNDEKIKIHSECVIESCINTVMNTGLNRDVFIIAGWIHDIGKKLDNESHHILSINFLKEFLRENPQFVNIQKEIKDCILNHRTGGRPETIYGLVFKCADKVALHNKKWIEYKKSK